MKIGQLDRPAFTQRVLLAAELQRDDTFRADGALWTAQKKRCQRIWSILQRCILASRTAASQCAEQPAHGPMHSDSGGAGVTTRRPRLTQTQTQKCQLDWPISSLPYDLTTARMIPGVDGQLAGMGPFARRRDEKIARRASAASLATTGAVRSSDCIGRSVVLHRKSAPCRRQDEHVIFTPAPDRMGNDKQGGLAEIRRQ
ncbi:MAG: hypothetical protein ABI389_05045 [Rhodanobacter sp.]